LNLEKERKDDALVLALWKKQVSAWYDPMMHLFQN